MQMVFVKTHPSNFYYDGMPMPYDLWKKAGQPKRITKWNEEELRFE